MMKNAPTFNINDYGPAFHAAVLKRAKAEMAKEETNWSAQFDTRPKDLKLKHFMMGHYAEQWLMNERGFRDSLEKWEDLFDPEDVLSEIKTKGNEAWIEGGNWPLVETLREFKLKYPKYAERAYIFVRDDRIGQYTFAGIWEWDKQQEKFIKELKKSLMFCNA